MKYRSIVPAAAVSALLSISACTDPATQTADEYEMDAEETAPVVSEPYETSDLPPPETNDPATRQPSIAEPAEPVADPAIEPINPITE